MNLGWYASFICVFSLIVDWTKKEEREGGYGESAVTKEDFDVTNCY